MQSSSKIVERRKDLRNVKDSDDLMNASQNKPGNITEIDLSFNELEYYYFVCVYMDDLL